MRSHDQRLSNSSDRRRARLSVEEAFRNTQYPGEAAIPREGTAYWTAVYGDKYEGAEIYRLFKGKRWQEIDLAFMRHPLGGFHQGFAAFLSDEAKGY